MGIRKPRREWLMMDQHLIRKEQQHILEIIKPVQYANLPQLLTQVSITSGLIPSGALSQGACRRKQFYRKKSSHLDHQDIFPSINSANKALVEFSLLKDQACLIRWSCWLQFFFPYQYASILIFMQNFCYRSGFYKLHKT